MISIIWAGPPNQTLATDDAIRNKKIINSKTRSKNKSLVCMFKKASDENQKYHMVLI
jgi:hypothetical protein